MYVGTGITGFNIFDLVVGAAGSQTYAYTAKVTWYDPVTFAVISTAPLAQSFYVTEDNSNPPTQAPTAYTVSHTDATIGFQVTGVDGEAVATLQIFELGSLVASKANIQSGTHQVNLSDFFHGAHGATSRNYEYDARLIRHDDLASAKLPQKFKVQYIAPPPAPVPAPVPQAPVTPSCPISVCPQG